MPGPVAITAIKAAGAVAQQRTHFLGRVLPPLLALANSGSYKVGGRCRGGGEAVGTRCL